MRATTTTRKNAAAPTCRVELDETAISEAETYASHCTHWSADGVFELSSRTTIAPSLMLSFAR